MKYHSRLVEFSSQRRSCSCFKTIYHTSSWLLGTLFYKWATKEKNFGSLKRANGYFYCIPWMASFFNYLHL